MRDYDPIEARKQLLKSQGKIIFLELICLLLNTVIGSTMLYKAMHGAFSWWYLLWLFIVPTSLLSFKRSLLLYRESKAYLARLLEW